MPKENTVDDVTDGLRVEVSWSSTVPNERDGHVQVATVHTLREAVMLDVEDPGERKLDGWHVTLSREGCNRLIRSLRRARDAAFGADA